MVCARPRRCRSPRQRQLECIGDIVGTHRRAQLPGDDVTRVVIEDGGEVVPAPADHLEIGEVGLPELVGRSRLVLELVGGLDDDEGWGYAKRTMERALAATRKRHAHRITVSSNAQENFGMKRRTNFGMLKPVRTARPNNLSTSTPWLADDAVDCEPVSVPNSLLTGKNTGKFTKLCPGRQSFWSRCARLSGTSVRLALRVRTGNL